MMQNVKNRKSEKGAAMVMVVMITLLLLAAIGGLMLEVSMNTANVSDSTAEQQAYNAAESGIQSAINVLRGNVIFDPSKPASDPVNQIDFRKAVKLADSNAVGDSSNVARLSRWIKYNYTPSGTSLADRVTLNSGYEPRNGYAFGVSVIDPDNTGNIVGYEVYGRIFHPVKKVWVDKNSVGESFPVEVDNMRISYSEPATNPTILDVTSGSANANFGNFKVDLKPGQTLGNIPEEIRFEIVVKMTAPYTISRGIRGYILPKKNITQANLNTIQFDFDSQFSQLMGSTISLNADTMTPNAGGILNVGGNMTQAEPFRVVVTSIGYGPRGAKKVLEATIQKNFFNGMTAPATLMLVGPPSKTVNGVTVNTVFEPGSSNNTVYSGQDVASNVIIPPVGTTNDANLNLVISKTLKQPPHPFNGEIVGTSANVNSEIPFWLENTTNLNATIESLKAAAQKSGTYYASGQTPTVVGDNSTARGLTFADGNLTLNPTMGGGGILVVTGKLTLHGNFNFNGLIIVTGAGGVERSGGGTGTLQGNIIIAPYNKNNLADGFLPPQYDLAGGGNSGVIYNSSSVANGMVAVSNFVLGVAEK